MRCFPFTESLMLTIGGDGYKEHWKSNPPKQNLFKQFNNNVIESFKLYSVPVIRLKKNTSREAVCLVFEKVNTKGVTLTVFELLTAIFAHPTAYCVRNGERNLNF